MKSFMKNVLLSAVLICSVVSIGYSQYFGKNKPRYRSFKFNVLNTQNYDIYYYLKNKELLNEIGQYSEMWYDMHAQVFSDSIEFTNPIILYNNHADFQQTNAISGAIGVGTGGVTEAFKNRVVMPLTFTHDQTVHVLGHELVHAFQYNTIIRGDSTNLNSLRNLPLWMVEGLAEYLSLGNEDPFTAMWMRDAVKNDRVPPLKKLTNPRFFPYRYGQAVWSYIAGTYGDAVIDSLFINTGRYGLDVGTFTTLNTPLETLSDDWRKTLKDHYSPVIADKDTVAYGKEIVNEKNGGRMNVAPSLSPNGKYVIFLSEKNVFSSDLFLAEARSGKIIRKLSDVVRDAGVDHLNVLESSGSWSPDSKKYAYVAFKKGRNVIIVKDVENGRTLQTITPKKVPAIQNPVWDADGKTIIFSGKVEGQVDLFAVNTRNNRVKQLTDTKYSEIQPDISKDGRYIVYVQDKPSGNSSVYHKTHLAILDRETSTTTALDLFQNAYHVSPQFDHEGNVLFVSDHDGFRNLYKYDISGSMITQLTDLATGVSGITKYSPCVSASKKRDAVVYSYYYDGKYNLYRAKSDQFKTLTPNENSDVAGILPSKDNVETASIVVANIKGTKQLPSDKDFERGRYNPKFKLDYIGGGTGIGIGSNNFGTATGLQGGVDMIFSDILGNHQLSARAALNGEIYDMGGQVTYLNRSNRLAYGFGIGHIPQRTGYQQISADKLQTNTGEEVDVIRRDLNIIRIFQEGISGFVHYPFSTTLRLEGGVQGNYQGFRQDQYSDYYAYNASGNPVLVHQTRDKVETADKIRFNNYYTLTRGFGANANVALVGDNSFFGLTAPLSGYRYRLSLEQHFGINKFTAALADGRYYQRLAPFTLAVRGTMYTRFEDRVQSVYPLYIGQMGFVRGYQSLAGSGLQRKQDISFDQLLGSKMMLGSAEIRLPFTGPKQLALIGSSAFFTDLNIFVDSGVAFDSFSHLKDGRVTQVYQTDDFGNVLRDQDGNPITIDKTIKPFVATNVGVSMRVNLFGAMIIEPYYAWSVQDFSQGTFGINLMPGW